MEIKNKINGYSTEDSIMWCPPYFQEGEGFYIDYEEDEEDDIDTIGYA